jgi:hypothetical protein
VCEKAVDPLPALAEIRRERIDVDVPAVSVEGDVVVHAIPEDRSAAVRIAAVELDEAVVRPAETNRQLG